MESVKKWSVDHVSKQTTKIAAYPNARSKLMAYVVIILVISSRIPETESGLAACRTCFDRALPFCKCVIESGSICDKFLSSAGLLSPLPCVCLLAAGGGACALWSGVCVGYCLVPTLPTA